LFISLAPPTLIQSDDASIKRRIVMNECGAYSRAALFNIFALICGALLGAALNQGRRLIV